MKTKSIGFLALCLISFSTILTSCGNATIDSSDSNSISSNHSSSENVVEKNDITLKIQATKSNINFIFANKTTKTSSNQLKIVGVKAYQYLEGDNINGLSNDIISYSNAKVFGTYNLGKNETISFDRYYLDDNVSYETKVEYDAIYNKYYVLDGNNIFLGPLYVTDIESEVEEQPTFNLKTKKGILGENISVYRDLNCSYVTLNLSIEELMYPNEIFMTGEGNIDIPFQIGVPDNAIEFKSNGKTYYFNQEIVNKYDSLIKSYYELGSHITAIIYAESAKISEQTFPIKMTYAPYSLQNTTTCALNTSNQYGFEYYIAMIEFIANRYSEDNYAKGYIANYVISNEIDYAKDYHRISEKQVDLDTFMEEYSRLLRLTNLAVKKYNSSTTVAVPFTHAWAQNGYVTNDTSNYWSTTKEVGAYAPKEMIEWLNNKTKLEGDYDWGIAPHCYGQHLAHTAVYAIDTSSNYISEVGSKGGRGFGMTNDYNTSTVISFSNLEILDTYLNQEELKYNGNCRNVYLTESGVSTCYDHQKERNIQAGLIAAIWYKVSQLDCIKSFSYYRMQDHSIEIANYTLFGLINKDGEKKPSYNVFKYIDTQYSEYVSKDYLQYVEYYDENGSLINTTNKVKSYLDVLDIFNTGYDFSNFDWKKAKCQTIDTVYEYEDKEDLSAITFDSKSFIYDGTEKEIVVNNVPAGVTVEYDDGDDTNDNSCDNKLTNIGSKTVLATLKRDGNVIGQRKATITINKYFSTNKTIYEYGESIFVTALSNANQSEKDWIGIFKKSANVGNNSNSNDISIFYYYPNKQDDKLRTTKIQKEEYYNNGPIDNSDDLILSAGEYTLYYLLNDGYEIVESINITVLSPKESTSSINLSNISFEDTSISLTNGNAELTITGTLPDRITVTYSNNTLSEVGTTNACAIFYKDNIEIERRYAVLTATPAKSLVMEKTTYYINEDIYVTSYSQNEGAWIGLYLQDDNVESTTSIYWCYVNVGVPTNIKNTTLNNSRIDYKDLPAGNYKMILFADGGYTIQETIAFTILNEYKDTINLYKKQYYCDEDIFIICKTNENEWVGIFNDDCTEYNETTLIKSYSQESQNQSINNLKVNIGQLNVGNYKIVIFSNSGFSTPTTSKSFSVLERLSTNKSIYEVGESILVTCAVRSELDWVGIFNNDCTEYNNNTLLGYYTPSTELQSINNLTVDIASKCSSPLPAGTYKIVAFNYSTYFQPYSYIIITIQ